MKICVIGGTGHIGKFLVPMLIEAGHEVIVVTSGRTPMLEEGAWKFVRPITRKYGAPGWTDAIRGIGSEVLVDILQGDSPELYMAVKDTVRHMIVCGSIWMLGFPRVVPTPAITQGGMGGCPTWPLYCASQADQSWGLRISSSSRTGWSSLTLSSRVG